MAQRSAFSYHPRAAADEWGGGLKSFMKRRRASSRIVLLLAIIFASLTAMGQTPPQQTPAQPATPQVFQPPPPAPDDKFDWIQLTSGEWLKGELIALYDEKLEFDSDELEELTLDWEDIRQVRTGRAVEVRFGKKDPMIGRLVMDGNTVQVVADTTQQFTRAELIAITPGSRKEISYWSGNATIGFNVRKGNSDELQTNTVVGLRRRTTSSRIILDYIGNYNLTNDITTTDNQRANSSVDWFVTSRFFVRPVVAEYLRDPFLNFASRWTVGAALGYQIVDNPRVSWDVNAGPAYQLTRFESVEEGESDEERTGALWAGTKYTNELTKDIDYTLDYRFLIVKPEAGRYTHHFITSLSIDSVGPLDFDISAVWDRVQRPRPDESGVVPKQNDYRLILGLGFDF